MWCCPMSKILWIFDQGVSDACSTGRKRSPALEFMVLRKSAVGYDHCKINCVS